MTIEGSDAYYRKLFEHLGMAVIATDADFNIRVWNTAAARIFGAGSKSMKGTPIVSIVPQDRRRAAELMLKRAVREGETIQFEFHHRDAQGVQRELAGTIASVVLESGERRRRVSKLSDVSFIGNRKSRDNRQLSGLRTAAPTLFTETGCAEISSLDWPRRRSSRRAD
jgi:PAS domain S-box-containing protein